MFAKLYHKVSKVRKNFKIYLDTNFISTIYNISSNFRIYFSTSWYFSFSFCRKIPFCLLQTKNYDKLFSFSIRNIYLDKNKQCQLTFKDEDKDVKFEPYLDKDVIDIEHNFNTLENSNNFYFARPKITAANL